MAGVVISCCAAIPALVLVLVVVNILALVFLHVIVLVFVLVVMLVHVHVHVLVHVLVTQFTLRNRPYITGKANSKEKSKRCTETHFRVLVPYSSPPAPAIFRRTRGLRTGYPAASGPLPYLSFVFLSLVGNGVYFRVLFKKQNGDQYVTCVRPIEC